MLEIEAQVEKITFRNEENNYTVAKLRAKEKNSLFTAVGYIPAISPGEVLRIKGYWKTHKIYGEQFHIVFCEHSTPSNEEAIEKYLGSGLIKGIGPEIAKRIVERFGKGTIKIISESPELLKEVPGIGEKRIEMIKGAWERSSEEREILLSLQGLGISPNLALKIYRQYGKDAITTVKNNPFRLAEDIYGVGFLTADKISKKLNIERDSPLRIEACIHYILRKASEEGHVYCPFEQLVKEASHLLGIEEPKVRDALVRLGESGSVVIDSSFEDKPVYIKALYMAEKGISEKMKKIASSRWQLDLLRESVYDHIQKKLGIRFTEAQLQAIKAALENKVALITGGPGTGKTTIIKGIVEAYLRLGKRVLLCAPTGRAAKKLEESTTYPAQTIHRLLEYNPQTKSFRRNERYPLQCDLIVVDESSMIDIVLMYQLMKAIPEDATVVFVGDCDQLPSVGPGAVFKDLIESNFTCCVRLKEIFRQSKESLIVINAHRINSGFMPIFENRTGKKADFLFYNRDNPDAVVKTIVQLVKSHIPSEYGIEPEEIQVLTPMYKGEMGVANLNSVLKDVINPRRDEGEKKGFSFRVGDKVIQMRNNYEKEVFNGDIGRVTEINPQLEELKVAYDTREVSYYFSELDEITLAYAISIHKSQGSEYEAVIVPIMTHHYVLLQRNLIYTALTRAKRLAVFIGTKKALAIGIKNNKPKNRYTLLAERLKKEFSIP